MINPKTAPKVLNVTAFPLPYRGGLPTASLLTPAYGVTVQSATRACPLYDLIFPLTTPVGSIVITEARNCRLVAVGEETVGKYRTFVESLEYSTADVNRTHITLGFVLWLQPGVHDAMIDLEAQRVYYYMPTTVLTAPVSGVTFTQPHLGCEAAGYLMAEPRTQTELYIAQTIAA